VLFGVYDREEDTTDSAETRDVAATVRQVTESWRGFQTVPEAEVDTALSRVDRAFVIQSDSPADKLASLERQRATITGDVGLTAKLRIEGGRKVVQLRVLSLPDPAFKTSDQFIDEWMGEGEVTAIRELLEQARHQAYKVADERVQRRPWGDAVVMHVPPPAVVAGSPARLTADILCRGTCNPLINYVFTSSKGAVRPEQARRMVQDPKTGAWSVDLAVMTAGRLGYYFSIIGADRQPLDADSSARTMDAPYSVQIVAPPSDLALPEPSFEHQSPVPGAITMSLAGATAVAGVAMALATQVWYVAPLTEKQAVRAKTFLPAVYVTLSVSGALMITGGAMLGVELNTPVDDVR
jgi:hypothetical protein